MKTHLIFAVLAISIAGCGKKTQAPAERPNETHTLVMAGFTPQEAFSGSRVTGDPRLLAVLPNARAKGKLEFELIPVGKKTTSYILRLALAQKGMRSANVAELAEFILQRPRTSGYIITLDSVGIKDQADLYVFLSPDIGRRELRGKDIESADKEGWNQKGNDVRLLAVR